MENERSDRVVSAQWVTQPSREIEAVVAYMWNRDRILRSWPYFIAGGVISLAIGAWIHSAGDEAMGLIILILSGLLIVCAVFIVFLRPYLKRGLADLAVPAGTTENVTLDEVAYHSTAGERVTRWSWGELDTWELYRGDVFLMKQGRSRSFPALIALIPLHAFGPEQQVALDLIAQKLRRVPSKKQRPLYTP